jgi:hypothetical protein
MVVTSRVLNQKVTNQPCHFVCLYIHLYFCELRTFPVESFLNHHAELGPKIGEMLKGSWDMQLLTSMTGISSSMVLMGAELKMATYVLLSVLIRLCPGVLQLLPINDIKTPVVLNLLLQREILLVLTHGQNTLASPMSEQNQTQTRMMS